MSNKRRVRELEAELATRDAQLTVAERLLSDKESVLEMYRGTYSELVGRLDTLTTVVDKLSRKTNGATPAKKTAPTKKATR